MRLTLGKKLGLGFGSILALMAASTVLSYLRVSEVQQIQSTVLSVRFPTLDGIRQLQRDLFQSGSKSRQAILAGDRRREERTGSGELTISGARRTTMSPS